MRKVVVRRVDQSFLDTLIKFRIEPERAVSPVSHIQDL